MKKLISLIVLAAWAFPAFALMDTKDFSATVVGTATGTQSYVIRGELEGVYVTVPSGGTATVTIASREQTLFTKSCTASAFYPILIPAYGTTGSALTQSAYLSTNVVYTKAAMAGSITATFVGENAASVTNSWKATILYSR
jgi:hypothetical protein